MKSRARMIATIAAVALLTPPFLYAAEASASSSVTAATVASALPLAAVGNAEARTVLATAQAGAAALPSGRTYNSYPKVELFLGYSYLRAMPTYSTGNRMVDLNGGSTSIAFNLNRYLGLVGDFGGFDASQINLTGAGASPSGTVNASGTAYTYMAGPRLSYRRHRITPFAQALFGGIHASQVTLSGCTGALCTPLPTENAFAMTAGGGLDLRVQRHISIRMVQAEYLMTRFANLNTGNRDTQNDMRLSTGLVFGFGGNAPQLPMSYACSVSPDNGYPGDPMTVTGTASNLNPNPKKTVNYTWSSTGGAVSGTSSTANIDTSATAPGTYTVNGHVSQGEKPKPDQMADCSASYTVKAFDPPTISCAASPSSVNMGDSSTIAASAVSPQNRPLTYGYNATAGSISSTTSTATLSTTGAAPGPITVTCNVSDDKGHSESATTSVNVIAPPPPPPPPAPLASSLCTVSFDRDAARPTRVDNEAKACLDDIALAMQRTSDASLAMVGNEGAKEQKTDANREKANRSHPKPSMAAVRAVNTKEYLVNEKGIDPSRILLYTGTDDSKTVTTTLVPSGATNPVSGDTPVDENDVLSVPHPTAQ